MLFTSSTNLSINWAAVVLLLALFSSVSAIEMRNKDVDCTGDACTTFSKDFSGDQKLEEDNPSSTLDHVSAEEPDSKEG